MSKPWDKWPKPWTREQCQRRYIQGGDRIGIRQLATDSGQPKWKVERWHREDSWTEKRKRFADNLETRTDEKTIELLSDKLSVELASITLENFRDYDSTLKLARRYFEYWNRHLDAIPSEDERRKIVTEKLNPNQMDKLAGIIDRAIKGQRIAAGLEYEDINKAIAKVKAAGYTVDEPDASPPTSQD